MSFAMPAKRGRPSKADLLERAAVAHKVEVRRSDAEVLSDLLERFGMLGKLTTAAVNANIRALVVTGAPGVGKTYMVENVLQQTKEDEDTSYEIVKGALSVVNLYKLGYYNRQPGNVIVLDDADSIFTDEDALNILKALCDSSPIRRVNWMKESLALKNDERGEVPNAYDFHGSFIFISNLDFQKYVDHGSNKYVAHFEALMSRSLYLDLRLHDLRAISLWIDHVATAGKLLEREGIPPIRAEKILAFIKTNRDNLRELSLRTLVKLAQLSRIHDDWERMGKVLLCRS